MRIALMAVRLFYMVPYYIIRIWWFGKSKRTVHANAFAFIKKATKRANRAGRVEIETTGWENLPEKDGFIVFANHQGLFDILVFLDTCPRPFAFLAKKEASNIILLKQVIAALGSYAMDREDLKQSMGVINSTAADVRNGKNFIIFPEGTRSKKGNTMNEFKGGSFKSATKAKCPIVPCALIDTYKAFDNRSIKPVTVKLICLSPLYYDEYKDMKTVEIAEEVRKRIETAIASKTSALG
jgi:1-acyl-sn-glycerol-3-phosphate acyltransferase